MLRWAARLLLFRILPRRLLPIITVIEVARMLRRRGEDRRDDEARTRLPRRR